MEKQQISWKDIRHFKRNEFACEDGTGENEINLKFVFVLDKIRDKVGKMKITSGYRTPAWNLKIGGVPNSAHTKGLAADILCKDSTKRYKLISTAIEVGISRIGIGKDFIHLDVDHSLPDEKVWTYY